MEKSQMAIGGSVTADQYAHHVMQNFLMQDIKDPRVLNLPEAYTLIILLHGIGSSSEDFTNIVRCCPDLSSRMLLFPDAPVQHVTLFKRSMRSWSDILSGDFEIGPLDWESFNKNMKDLSECVEKLKTVYGFKKVIIGGFSQGGFNVWTGMKQLSVATQGMAIFSTSLNNEFVDRLRFDLGNYPFFYSYGSEDIMMPEYFCKKSEQSMRTDFKSRNFTCYHAAHGHEIDQAAAEEFWKWEEALR